MLRALGKTLFLAVLVVAGSVGLYFYHYRTTVEHHVEQLEQQNHELEQIRQRLKAERRVAKVLVTDQKTVNGVLKTTLLFVEYDRDGAALPGKEFTLNGNEAHFDAEIIKFKDQFVESGDPLRGQSIMLFTRVYGADQAPKDGFPIDEPGKIPELYRGSDARISSFEQGLWDNFWSLYNDKAKRDEIGIRGLHGEGLWGRFDMDHVYTITVRADGGTINEDPIEPIFRQAMRHRDPL